MNKIIVIEFWFKNGTKINKDLDMKNLSQTRQEEIVSGLLQIKSVVMQAFKDDARGNIEVGGMIIRLQELCAMDIKVCELDANGELHEVDME